MEISNAAYGAGWAGDTLHAASLDAIFDRISQITGTLDILATGMYQPVASTVNPAFGNLTLHPAHFIRGNDSVVVAGTFTTQITVAAATYEFFVSLPFASNFTANNGSGAGSMGSLPHQIYIDSNTANDVMRFGTRPTTVTATDIMCSYVFGYRILP